MARKRISRVVVIDDATGEEITEQEAHHVVITIDERTWKLELGQASTDQILKAIEPLVANVAPQIRRKTRVDSQLVRTWAAENGYAVHAKGRIPEPIIEKYLAENPQD